MAKTGAVERYEEFVLRVAEPALSYSFRVQHDRRRVQSEPFQERQSVHFVTECLWPDRFAGRSGNATIYPRPAFADPALLPDDNPLRGSVGFVRVTKTVFEVVVYLPPAACWRIGEAMAVGLVCSMLANGRVEGRGMVKLTSASFRGVEFDPVAYVR